MTLAFAARTGFTVSRGSRSSATSGTRTKMHIDLQKRLESIHALIAELKTAEEVYFFQEAHKDVLYSSLFKASIGGSIAEREAGVYVSDSWKNFSKSLASAHATYNEMRRKYELRMKAFDAEYLSVKIDGQIIPRGMSDDRGDRER